MGFAAPERNGVKEDPNDQGLMTKEIRIAKTESRPAGLLGASPFVFLSDWVIRHCSFLFVLSALFASVLTGAAEPGDRATILLVVGAPGEAEYGTNFAQWAATWERASRDGAAKFVSIGLSATNSLTDLAQLKGILSDEARESAAELWLVLIGHGTFDGKEAKFNLRGPDLSATDLAEWLKPFRRPLAVIDCASSSGPFLNKLSATNRVIITATRSGYEQNYARFGEYISSAVADPQADLDKDGQTSLLEAFLMASRRVAEVYESAARLATEHALLDDNGDGLGTPADWFRGIRAVKKAREDALADGLRAHQFHMVRSEQERRLSPEMRAKRDELELGIARLREAKSGLKEDDYYQRLENLLTGLAKLYEQDTSKPQ